MMRRILGILVMLATVVQIAYSQVNMGGPRGGYMNTGGGPPPARLCGETMMLRNPASRMGYPPQGYMQRPAAYTPPRQQQYQMPTRPIYSIDVPPPFRHRGKRQAPRFQPAFVPDMSHLNQGAYYPPQRSPPQQYNMHNQRFLSPRQPSGIHGLLMALDPPDAPDLPDFYLATTPRGRVSQGNARQGPGAPQPGPQINMPTNGQPQPAHVPGAPVQQHPRANPTQHRQAAPIPYQPRIPIRMPGVDTVCFCTDTQTCLLLEGNMEVMYMQQCANPPPPNVPNGPLSDVCCCVG